MFFVILLALIAGCEDTKSDLSVTALTLQCDLTSRYTPRLEPVTSLATSGSPLATVIVVHGKNASPLDTHIQTLQSSLNVAEFDVVTPYMPWSGIIWHGTLCDSISYLNELIASELLSGKYVILLGHSLGGSVVSAYAAMEDTAKADAVSIVAPAHFIHQSSTMAAVHASSLSRANTMVRNGLGHQTTVFDSYDLGNTINISTTADIYLSMNDTSQFPDILSTIPLAASPTLWLAGTEDSLTTTVKELGIYSAIPTSGPYYTYKEVSGDHFGVLSHVPAELNLFF